MRRNFALLFLLFAVALPADTQRRSAKPERVYAENPAAWFEAARGSAQISDDGKWALFPSFGRGIKLVNLETGAEDAARLMQGLDRVSLAVFYKGNQLARLGSRGRQLGWFIPGPDGPQLTSLPLDAAPRWSPDGSAVAYVRPGQLEKGLFIADAQRQRQFTVEGRLSGFAWSPDARLIYALAWHEDGMTSLARIARETGIVETLAQDLDALPTWNTLATSPDGKTLYIALAGEGAPDPEARHDPDAKRDLNIYALDITTGARRVLVELPDDDFAPVVAGGYLYWTHNDIHDAIVAFPAAGGVAHVIVDRAQIPYWRPDGKQIAFTHGGWRLADWALNLDTAVVGVDSHARRDSKIRPLVTGYHEDFTPAWSPDGKWIAYHSHRSPTAVSEYAAAGSTDDLYLRRFSRKPTEEIRLTDFGWEVGVTDWSPDSTKLVFDSWERGGAPRVSKPWIVTIDPATGKPVSVERLPLPAHIRNATWESWSPDGAEIAFEEHVVGAKRILWVVSTDGTRADQLAEYSSNTYGGLDWTPDGKSIVFGALADDHMQIFSVARAGGPPQQLSHDLAHLMHPQVSPDSRWIACTRIAQSKEIWRLKL